MLRFWLQLLVGFVLLEFPRGRPRLAFPRYISLPVPSASFVLGVLLSTFWLAVISIPLPFIGGPYLSDDWAVVFYPAAQYTAAGETPYTDIPVAFHPQPLYSLLTWSAYLPMIGSYLVLVALLLLLLLYVSRALGGGGRAVTLALFASPFLGIAILLGQVTGIEVAGVLLACLVLAGRGGWLVQGGAYLLLAATPPNTIPLLLYIAWVSFRRSRRDFACALCLALAGLLLTFWQVGFWLPDFLEALAQARVMTDNAQNLSLWHHAPALGVAVLEGVLLLTWLAWPRLREAPPETQALFLLAGTLTFSSYLLGHRFLPAYILACVCLARHSRRYPLALLLFSSTLLMAYHLTDMWLFLYLMAPVLYAVSIHDISQKEGAWQIPSIFFAIRFARRAPQQQLSPVGARSNQQRHQEAPNR